MPRMILITGAAGKTGKAIITSSDVNEVSRESEAWGGGHGIFTLALLEFLISLVGTSRLEIINITVLALAIFLDRNYSWDHPCPVSFILLIASVS